jgi:hypothetical protein
LSRNITIFLFIKAILEGVGEQAVQPRQRPAPHRPYTLKKRTPVVADGSASVDVYYDINNVRIFFPTGAYHRVNVMLNEWPSPRFEPR